MSAKRDRIFFRLQRAAHVLRKRADRALLESGGITTAQAAVLQLAAERKDVTQRKLASELRQNESAMTAMVARLVELRLLTKVRSTEDGRIWALEVTQQGDRALQAIAAPFEEINTMLEHAIGLESMTEFSEMLTAITNDLGS